MRAYSSVCASARSCARSSATRCSSNSAGWPTSHRVSILDDDIERAWLRIRAAGERELDHWLVELAHSPRIRSTESPAPFSTESASVRPSQGMGKPELTLERTVALADGALRVEPEYRERGEVK